MCIGLHTLPPCLLFCGNYILHESEYDVHIFCVALDIIIYPAALTPLGGTPPNPIFKNYVGFSTDRNGAYQEDMLRYFFYSNYLKSVHSPLFL